MQCVVSLLFAPPLSADWRQKGRKEGEGEEEVLVVYFKLVDQWHWSQVKLKLFSLSSSRFSHFSFLILSSKRVPVQEQLRVRMYVRTYASTAEDGGEENVTVSTYLEGKEEEEEEKLLL